MAHQLTEGALWKISQGDFVTEPVLQVLGKGESKFSDGKFSWNGLFWPWLDIPASFTIIKLTSYLVLSRGLEGVIGILIFEFEILAPGDQIGVKLGNPAEIGYDGNVTGGSLEAKLIALGSKLLATRKATGDIEKMCVEDGILFDFTIISEEGVRFPCHRVVLAAKSATMKARLTTEMMEKEDAQTTIHHNNKVVGAFVDFFYKGEVPQDVLEANLPTFMDLSEFYQMDQLKAQVEAAAIKTLSMENVVEMFGLAKKYNADTLLEATKLYIVENKKMIGKQDFSQVPKIIADDLFKLVA